ncbi:MAG: hypothetical protein QM754_10855 [Tepidisphaeraceae bacterium]
MLERDGKPALGERQQLADGNAVRDRCIRAAVLEGSDAVIGERRVGVTGPAVESLNTQRGGVAVVIAHAVGEASRDAGGI